MKSTRSTQNIHRALTCALAFVLFLPVAATAQVQSCNVTPNTQDSYTALLDHLNGSTLGQVYGNVSYGGGINGLAQAVQFSNGSSIEYTLNGWYQWTSDYQPDGKYGAIELWIKPAASRVPGDFLVVNWYSSTTPPNSGYITVLGLDSDGRLTFADWTSITNNPADTSFSPPHTVLPANAWSHISYTWSPAGTAVYVNGQLEATSTLNYYPALNSTVYLYLNPWGSNVLSAADELRVSTIGRASMMKCAN